MLLVLQASWWERINKTESPGTTKLLLLELVFPYIVYILQLRTLKIGQYYLKMQNKYTLKCFFFAINIILFVMWPSQLLDRAAACMHSSIWQERASHVHYYCLASYGLLNISELGS